MPRPQDHYGTRAKKLGYPARSVFKLQEIEERFRLIPPSPAILDVGAAPGSFSLFLLKKIGLKGRVVGVDLAPSIKIPPHFKNYTYICGDIFAQNIQAELIKLGPYNLIVSDAAPATSGQKEIDALRSISLAECVLSLAQLCLLKGGNLLLKIFQGVGEQDLLNLLRANFQKVRGFKPKASRSESFETYFIGQNYKGKE